MYISHISASNGQKAILPKQITGKFRDFYSSLYNLPDRSPAQTTMENYISSSQLPTLPTKVREELESPITLDELQ